MSKNTELETIKTDDLVTATGGFAGGGALAGLGGAIHHPFLALTGQLNTLNANNQANQTNQMMTCMALACAMRPHY